MKPVRTEQERAVARDPWTGAPSPVGQKKVAHLLGSRGGLHSVQVDEVFACSCGCVRPLGGFCSQCHGTVCVACFGRCAACLRPLCPRHTIVVASATPIRLCAACHGDSRRSRVLRGVARCLLAPFVEFPGHDRR